MHLFYIFLLYHSRSLLKAIGELLYGKASPMMMSMGAQRHMVESYDASFGPGDAVQIQDGIVHAGPGCDEQQRVVIFMTYRPFKAS